MKDQKKKDSWASLLTDLGLEAPGAEEVAAPEAPAEKEPATAAPIETAAEAAAEVRQRRTETVVTETDSFGAGLFGDAAPAPSVDVPEPVSTEPAPEEPQKTRQEKKSFLARFPKINFFGTSTKETLDAVVEGVKAPSLSGKSFTSNTMEKVPGTPERATRKPKAEQAPEPKAVEKPVEAAPESAGSDPWSQIASQVGALTGEAPPRKTDEREKKPSSRQEKREPAAEKRGRRRTPSLFEDPVPESDETKTLKNLIGEETVSDEEEKRLQSMFVENRKDREPRGRRDVREAEPEAEESPAPRGRGGRREQRQDRGGRDEKPARRAWEEPESTPEVRSEEPRSRGRRGSRYAEPETKIAAAPPVDSSDDVYDEPASWDVEVESKPVERGRRRRGRRPETVDAAPEPTDFPQDSDDGLATSVDFSQIHKKIPSWDEAIGAIVEGNIARRGQQPPPRRNRR